VLILTSPRSILGLVSPFSRRHDVRRVFRCFLKMCDRSRPPISTRGKKISVQQGWDSICVKYRTAGLVCGWGGACARAPPRNLLSLPPSCLLSLSASNIFCPVSADIEVGSSECSCSQRRLHKCACGLIFDR
jgi:hypothetical protein